MFMSFLLLALATITTLGITNRLRSPQGTKSTLALVILVVLSLVTVLDAVLVARDYSLPAAILGSGIGVWLGILLADLTPFLRRWRQSREHTNN